MVVCGGMLYHSISFKCSYYFYCALSKYLDKLFLALFLKLTCQ